MSGDKRTSAVHARKERTLVVAGILFDGDRVLISQRKLDAHLGGMWEFPGGKIEAGESPRAALERELKEEIGIDADVHEPIEITFHAYPQRELFLMFFRVTLGEGSPPPTPIYVEAVKFARAEELDDKAFPPADVEVLARVRDLLRQRAL
jgi:8-oxo-dGTP diphosphatase